MPPSSTSSYKSTDGGKTWSDFSHGLPLGDVIALAVNRSSGILYAAINLNSVYRSVDGGSNWIPCGVLPALTTSSTTGLSVDSATNSISGDSVGVFRSTDGCQNWQSSNSGVVTASSQHQPSLRRHLRWNLQIHQWRISSWNPVAQGPTGTVVISIVEDPVTTGTFYLGTDTGVFRSTNSGENWYPISS